MCALPEGPHSLRFGLDWHEQNRHIKSKKSICCQNCQVDGRLSLKIEPAFALYFDPLVGRIMA
jgi:hypothetical protein